MLKQTLRGERNHEYLKIIIEPPCKISITRISFRVTKSVKKEFQISLILFFFFLTTNLEHYVNHTLPLERENIFKNMMYINCIFQGYTVQCLHGAHSAVQLHEAFYFYRQHRHVAQLRFLDFFLICGPQWLPFFRCSFSVRRAKSSENV